MSVDALTMDPPALRAFAFAAPRNSKGLILRWSSRGVRLPSCDRFIVGGARIDPTSAFGRLFFFPERRFGFQIIDDEAARIERCAAMRAGHGDQHDLVRWAKLTDTMDDQRIVDVEALPRLDDDGAERFLGHSRIVLERHLQNLRISVHVADRADERDHRTDTRIALAERSDFLRHVEVRRLNANGHFIHPLRAAEARPRHLAAPE